VEGTLQEKVVRMQLHKCFLNVAELLIAVKKLRLPTSIGK
jgi:hypothetical protein